VSPVPTRAELGNACFSFLILALCAGAGAADWGVALRGVPAGFALAAAAALPAVPALAGARGGARAFARAGELLIGAAPAVILISSVSGLWVRTFCLAAAGAAAGGCALVARAAPRGAGWCAASGCAALGAGWSIAPLVARGL